MNRLIAAALALTIVGVGSVAAPRGARAIEASDIPGVPLIGNLVASEVGGASVDRVYSLDVERGTSLLLTLRGESGAELGLYVFDAESTSVVTDDPIATSALPGAVQSVSLMFFAATHIYINVNGRNGNRAFLFQLGISVVVDRTPPVIRTALANVVGTGRRVCAQIEAFDGVSGVQSVAVSTVGSDQSLDWQPYTGRSRYCSDLDLPEGSHALLVHARNTLQMVATLGAGVILIDNRAPIVTIGGPRGGVMLNPRGSLGFKFNEPVRFVGTRQSGLIVVAQTGERLRGMVEIAKDRTSVKWTPETAVPVGTVIVAMLAQIRDDAGNVTTPLEPNIVSRKHRTALSLTIESDTARRVVLRIRSSLNLVGESVMLEVRTGRSWELLRTVKLATNSIRLSIQRAEWRQARVVWVGSELLHLSSAESANFY